MGAPTKEHLVLFALLLALAVLPTCNRDSSSGGDGGIDSGTDVDTDTDTDTDTDSGEPDCPFTCLHPGDCGPSNGLVHPEYECPDPSDTCCDLYEIDTDSDTDTDTDPGWPIVDGCDVIVANSFIHFEGGRAMDGDRMVWTEFDWDIATPVLKMRELSSSVETVLFADEDYEFHPVISGDLVFWEQELISSDWTTRELFWMDLADSVPNQITDNDCAEADVHPSGDYFVFTSICEVDGDIALFFQNLTETTPTMIVEDSAAPPGTGGIAFDGRYVVWGWYDESSDQEADQIWLFDILNPTPPTEPLYPECRGQVGAALSDGKIYASTVTDDLTEGFDIWIYDIESETMSWLDHSPYDQIGAHVDGHIAVYIDTEELGTEYFVDGMESHVEIHDIDTHVTRQLTTEENTYVSLGIAGNYVAFEVESYLVLCDLLAGGLVDADGHVCPEEGCPEPDAGPDDGGVDGGLDGGK